MSTDTLSLETLSEAEQLLYLEADLLDRHHWDDWIALYTKDCVFWVPSWDTEEELIDDPEVEVNMVYLKGLPAIEARLVRIRSRDAYALTPLPKTAHMVTNVRVVAERDEIIEVSAKWTTLCLEPRRGKTWRGGWYDYTLRRTDAGLRIQTKKIVLLEGMIDGTIDIYQI